MGLLVDSVKCGYLRPSAWVFIKESIICHTMIYWKHLGKSVDSKERGQYKV